MKVVTTEQVVKDVDRMTIEMKPGDILSIAVPVSGDGKEYHVINVMMQGVIAVVEHEQTGDAMVIRPGGEYGRVQYVKG